MTRCLPLPKLEESLLKPDVVDVANHFFTHGFCLKGGLRINMHKSKIMGVVVDKSKAVLVAANIGVTKAIHGVDGKLGCSLKTSYSSNWNDIVRELSLLHDKGMDLLGLIKKKTGKGENTMSWEET
ncbi:hypothetical protein Tco_0822349 [Tanacetum coccineum]|uniref:Uncharacterized protein n=1 Tax=Tanacetum coccineum TaxID=301880 RepID=A0ABQ5AET3_9ASTR